MILALVFVLVAGSADTLYSIPPSHALSKGEYRGLPTEWRYTGDDAHEFAHPEFDDRTWTEVDVRFTANGPIEDWTGLGWFRLRVTADSQAVASPPGLFLAHRGAVEVYLNGRRLYASGRPHPRADSTRAQLQSVAAQLPLMHGENVIAVRYANHRPRLFHRAQTLAGFFPAVVAAYPESLITIDRQRRLSAWQYFFSGLLAALALFHLSLFAFHRQDRANLHLFAVALSLGALTWILLWRPVTPEGLIYRVYALNSAAMLTCVTMLAATYRLLCGNLPRYLPYAIILLLGALVLVLTRVLPNAVLLVAMLLTAMELVRTAAIALIHKRTGARPIAVGVCLLALSIAYAMAAELSLLPLSGDSTILVPLLGMLGFTIAASVSLSIHYARTNTDLAQRLVEVQRLSTERLEQERRLREEERRGEDMRIALETKAAELEEARQLQLSLLPAILPDHPDLEIAAFMETAAEVGGDYYDFHLCGDTLTIAVGDATGHGLRAGSMVTATKALFASVMADGHGLAETLRLSTGALKRMNMSKLFMALTLARWNGDELQVAAAGMPPVLIHRRATGSVESIRITGMPLGGFADFPYREESIRLDPGDTVVFMSDGFPERFSTGGEMYGYDEAVQAFADVADQSLTDIILALRNAAEYHAGGRQADDDMTFVVIRRRAVKVTFLQPESTN